MVDWIHVQKRQVQIEYESRDKNGNFTLDDYLFASVITTSRAYGTGCGLPSEALVPISDLANTRLSANNVNYSWSKLEESFYMRSNQAISKNTEIYDSYQVTSLKANDRLAYNYGFLFKDNPTRVAPMKKNLCDTIRQRRNSNTVLLQENMANLFDSVWKESCGETVDWEQQRYRSLSEIDLHPRRRGP